MFHKAYETSQVDQLSVAAFGASYWCVSVSVSPFLLSFLLLKEILIYLLCQVLAQGSAVRKTPTKTQPQ